jgi:hypothetical protein
MKRPRLAAQTDVANHRWPCSPASFCVSFNDPGSLLCCSFVPSIPLPCRYVAEHPTGEQRGEKNYDRVDAQKCSFLGST